MHVFSAFRQVVDLTVSSGKENISFSTLKFTFLGGWIAYSDVMMYL